jgi:predicted dehydrogenase
MNKLQWGVLGVAKIATAKVIPAMQGGELTEVTAIASRDAARAQAAADELGIAKAYGSYAELLDDPDVDAVYNPLPNHLHKPWTIAAAERGKHVLCEKPLALNAAEAADIIAARDRTGVKMQEAFMVWTHPQWQRAVEICRSGRLGKLRSYTGHFSYFSDDPDNIRNFPHMGGGALMDIGCYLLTTSRMIFGEEPRRVLALIERDPEFEVDALTSIMLDYPSGQAIGTCSTRMIYYQRVQVFGSEGRLEIDIPFNAPTDRPCRLWLDNEGDLTGATVETIEIDTCNQFRIQGDEFSRAVLNDTEVPYPLEMSLANMKLIDALFRSAQSGRWETAD